MKQTNMFSRSYWLDFLSKLRWIMQSLRHLKTYQVCNGSTNQKQVKFFVETFRKLSVI